LRPSGFQTLLQLSVNPLHHAIALGVEAVVVMCLTPICWQVEARMEEVNWLPLSEVMLAGMPNLATQLLMRASMQVSVSMETKGMASSHLLD